MASLLPNGSQQFVDANGNPLAGGFVYFYIAGTTTPKTVWADANQITPLSNPVILNVGGYAVIYGEGTYRQVVTDSNGVQIWDDLTSSPVTAGGLLNVQTFTASGTYTPTAGCNTIRITVVGAGASGGGTGTTAGWSGGGGGGGGAAVWYGPCPGVTSFTVGTGGVLAPGNTGGTFGNNGNNGTPSTFSGITAGGGVQGLGSVPTGSAGGGVGGIATGGNILNTVGVAGGDGAPGASFPTGSGGSSIFGGGGMARYGANQAQFGGAPGAGGGAAYGSASTNSGAGADGIIIVEEFS